MKAPSTAPTCSLSRPTAPPRPSSARSPAARRCCATSRRRRRPARPIDLAALAGTVTALAISGDDLLARHNGRSRRRHLSLRRGQRPPPAGGGCRSFRPRHSRAATSTSPTANASRSGRCATSPPKPRRCCSPARTWILLPVGLQLSGKRLFVASAGSRTLDVFDLDSRAAAGRIDLDFTPATLAAFGDKPLWLMNAGDGEEPLYVLEGGREPAVYFVPAGRETVTHAPLPLILITAALAALCASAQTAAPPFSIRTQQGTTVQVISRRRHARAAGRSRGRALRWQHHRHLYRRRPSPSAPISPRSSSPAPPISPWWSVPDLTNGPLTLSPNRQLRHARALSALRQPSRPPPKSPPRISRTTVPASFSINLTGTAPEFAYTYALLPNGNTTLLSGGETIQFPDTNLAETSVGAGHFDQPGSGAGRGQRHHL